VAERRVKEAAIDKDTLERLRASEREELERQAAQLAEAERQRAAALARNAELEALVASKQALLDSAEAGKTLLARQVEQLSAKGDEQRGEFEATTRKLAEELQNERSERALAQGALEVSRSYRTELETKLVEMKRRMRVHVEVEKVERAEPIPLGRADAWPRVAP
jgi:crescentin